VTELALKYSDLTELLIFVKPDGQSPETHLTKPVELFRQSLCADRSVQKSKVPAKIIPEKLIFLLIVFLD